MESGNYANGIPEARKYVEDAHRLSRPDLEVRATRLVGAAELHAARHREALQTLLKARDLAARQRDLRSLLSINNNVAWIYLDMANLDSAAESADEALAAARALHYSDDRLMTLRAFIYALSKDFAHAEPLFTTSIQGAIDRGDLNLAATDWQFLSESYYRADRLEEAQEAATESFRLRKLHHLPDLEVSLRDLGKVLAARGDLTTGGVLIEQAVAQMREPKNPAPIWVFFRERGRLRVMKGDFAGALVDLRDALELAHRIKVIPTDDNRVTFESELADLYSLLIDTGNRLYAVNHDSRLKEEIFEAAEENRAASLRALVPQPDGWRTKLPLEYNAVLEQLETAERALELNASDSDAAARARLSRARLHEIEFQAGANDESGRYSALKAAQLALDDQSAILAFHLSARASWLWAITRDRFSVYALPPKPELAAESKRFREAIRAKDPDIADLGDRLGRQLLEALPSGVHAKRRWIVALDQDLFDLPLGALRWKGRYLIEDHALLLTPGLRILQAAGSRPGFRNSFAGVGDPVYNRADSRLVNHRPSLFSGFPFSWFAGNAPAADRSNYSGQLSRLIGSGKEVQSALGIWGSGLALTGPDATRENLYRVMAEQRSILHLATHVIKVPRYRSGEIVLSIGWTGAPEMVDMNDILHHPVKVDLVVMSGCASGDAVALPASGLMGLTRAWLGAGAGEVLATRWPALDDSGEIFDAFYRNLRANPELGAPEALRRAQLEMLHSRSFRSNPDSWASYFLIGKV